MKNGIVILAHAPLASALRQAVLHVFAERGDDVVAIDVAAQAPVAQTLEQARAAIGRFAGVPLLVLSDMMGATPCNVARQLAAERPARLLAGVNLPMLLRALTYQGEPLDMLAQRAREGGSQGVVDVPA